MKRNKYKIAFLLLIILLCSFLLVNKNKIKYYYDVHISKTIDITEYPFYASGNGTDNDTWAIQEAIDTLSSNGGGTVVLKRNHNFLGSTIIMKDNINLCIEEDAKLIQSNDQNQYVNYNNNTAIEYSPIYGLNVSDYEMWDHSWYLNPPFIYAPEGTSNIKITGSGKINMVVDGEEDNILHITPIGFFEVSNFEITDITIEGYDAYACMLLSCNDGIVKNITIKDPKRENNDGITIMNCRNIRITECNLLTGDDGIYIFSSYKDPRKSFWWNSDDLINIENIEIDNNNCKVTDNRYKAFGMILWSNETDESYIKDINIHDNYFQTVGVWDESTNPFFFNDTLVQINNIQWTNNKIDYVQDSFNRLKNIVDLQ